MPTPTLGSLIRRLRCERGLTIEEASVLCGCSFVAWAKYESDHRTPSLAVAKRVADVLGVPLEELARHARLPYNLRSIS
jgi:transcriptional regulator with XRE-family HTH domain